MFFKLVRVRVATRARAWFRTHDSDLTAAPRPVPPAAPSGVHLVAISQYVSAPPGRVRVLKGTIDRARLV